MRICGISDMHGQYDFSVEKSDILCICGDVFPLMIQDYTKDSEKWVKNRFIPWCNEQPVEKVFVVGGNHDFYLYRHSDKFRELIKDTKIIYLQDESYSHIDNDGRVFKIYGTPWCHQFGRWAFMGYSDEKLKEIYDNMPDDVDILLTHDATYGCSDVLAVDRRKQGHIGGPALRDIVLEKKPKLHLHGHLHTTNHDKETLGDTDIYCVSLLDEDYIMYYKPLYIEV